MTNPAPVPLKRKLLIGFSAAGIGLVVGYVIARFAPHSGGHRWSDILALGVAVGLALMGGTLLLAGVSPQVARRLARTDKVPKKRVRQFVRQGATAALAGIMLAIPPVFIANEGIDDTRSGLVMAAIALMFAVQTRINLDLWRQADEVLRRALIETSALSFWVLQGALFLWAVAERTGFVPPLESWDAVTVLMAVYMGLSIYVGRRVGAE